ncbi:hypothetical protein PT2222_390065 [Paraburkholderia tropica]
MHTELPSLQTTFLLAVSAYPSPGGPSREEYVVPEASHPTVTSHACSGRQLLVAQQVTAASSTNDVHDKTAMSFPIPYTILLNDP